MTMQVPDVSGMSIPQAALAYAAAGFYVLPTDPAVDVKHPGSVVGKDWTTQSSRSAGDILAWFDPDHGGNPSYGIALHLGRSGCVAFDVDKPENVPAWLNSELLSSRSPIQTTRKPPVPDLAESLGAIADSTSLPAHPRGHRLFTLPSGSTLGNSTKGLIDSDLGPWGDIRGTNGVIVVEPTPHPDPVSGSYRWIRGGPIAPLPSAIASRMAAPVSSTSPSASLAELSLPTGLAPSSAVSAALASCLSELGAAAVAGAGRHDAMNRGVLRLVRLGEQGHPGVHEALSAIRMLFENSLAGTAGRSASSEWDRGLAGAWDEVSAKRSPPEDTYAYQQSIRDPLDPSGGLVTSSSLASALLPSSLPGSSGSLSSPSLVELGSADWFERRVQERLADLRINEEAVRRHRADGIATEPPESITLGELLAEEDLDIPYRVDGLWPVEGRALIAAQAKAGKTTLMGNLVKSLLDAQPFLGRFPVKPLTGRIALIDNEMSREQIKRWYRCFHIDNTSGMAVRFLRGKVSQFNILDPKIRTEWANWLREENVELVIFDCIRPVLDALGLSEDKDAGRFLVAYDELLKEAGVVESALVHHMGHNGERSRGDSRLVDWPDVTWKLVLEDPDSKTSDRYFSAYGRDVEFEEDQIFYNPATHEITLSGLGSRKTVKNKVIEDEDNNKVRELREAVMSVLQVYPNGISKNQLEKSVTGNKPLIRQIINMLIADGTVETSQVGRAIMIKLTLGGA